ncbi:hypothetical protein CAOG_009495 [Capsaspora owczarzaki ATCC 30864]|uniref:Uncharacterized protein n=1 Tax=Capsaspora owczarzaki (strain ATCC 30864) TaxID=595528 RepID=A0A0D2X1I1_CAPO3|nr:hypothetical protein CAOG_009495 [Capsaspora owczarzaki ATCC 30864]
MHQLWKRRRSHPNPSLLKSPTLVKSEFINPSMASCLASGIVETRVDYIYIVAWKGAASQ